MKVIHPAEELIEDFRIFYQRKGEARYSGWSFPCTKEGVILTEKMCPEAIANLLACQSGEYDVEEPVFEDNSRVYTPEPYGLCDNCHQKVVIRRYGYAHACEKCGWEYNTSGTPLVSRSLWIEDIDPEPGVFSTGDDW